MGTTSSRRRADHSVNIEHIDMSQYYEIPAHDLKFYTNNPSPHKKYYVKLDVGKTYPAFDENTVCVFPYYYELEIYRNGPRLVRRTPPRDPRNDPYNDWF
jgi:hypothetical protein